VSVSQEVWVFDLDGCIVDSHTGTSLRPGALELLEQLRSVGARVVLWSAGGADYARRRADEHGVTSLFDAFHEKDGRDGAGRYLTAHFLADHRRVVFVDDRPEDMPEDAEVIAVSPYLGQNPHDRGLAPARSRAARMP
jgi:phosphoglycolate phosphatase-like HAD superfamily hydrolase